MDFYFLQSVQLNFTIDQLIILKTMIEDCISLQFNSIKIGLLELTMRIVII